MAADGTDLEQLVGQLRTRPGRGGVRLSIAQADRVLELLELLRAVLDERARMRRAGRLRVAGELDPDAVELAAIELMAAAGRPEVMLGAWYDDDVVTEYDREAWREAVRRVVRTYLDAARLPLAA